MAINIEIGDEPENPGVEMPAEEPLPPSKLKMSMNIRRTLEGHLVISDHPDIDIVVQPNDMKIVAFPKTVMSDEIYSIQNRLFDYLKNGGIITRGTVKGGNVYGALEGTIGTPTKTIAIDEISVFAIGKFIEEERPAFMYEKASEEKEEERLTEPDDEASTELGEVPHEEKKGSIIPHAVRRYISGV